MNIEELKRLAEAATPGPWMRIHGESIVYERMSDGCRGNSIVARPFGWTTNNTPNLDYVAAANPAAVLELIRQRDELLAALSIFMEVIDRPPEASCSCHISPPCNDCVENFGLREAFSFADAAIAKAEG